MTNATSSNASSSNESSQHASSSSSTSPSHYKPVQLTPEQLQKSTAEIYQQELNGSNAEDIVNFVGAHAYLRTQLDYTYHKVPTKDRQKLQDGLMQEILSQRTEECQACHDDFDHPQVLFTAGAMASGKGHTLRLFLKNGKASLPKDFVWIDPDKLARMLPERQQYFDFDKAKAPMRLHPEASMMQEILCLYAREQRRSHVVDGSLSDGEWFKQVMHQYRKDGYSIEIFFVFADEDVMERRAKRRERETGRSTDRKHIERSAQEAPRSVQELAKREHVHRVRIIDNSQDDDEPVVCYDSQGDDCFEQDGGVVDVFKWVKKGNDARHHKEEELKQGKKLA
ncbi:hypothetical protein EMMF5_000249 [Cystobasidiomycetes sp. EMM_F5]